MNAAILGDWLELKIVLPKTCNFVPEVGVHVFPIDTPPPEKTFICAFREKDVAIKIINKKKFFVFI